MATLYKANGEIIEVSPENGERFTLVELYDMLSCELVERLILPRNKIMIVDEEGKLRRKDTNAKATRIYHSAERMNIYDWIAGDALVCDSNEF